MGFLYVPKDQVLNPENCFRLRISRLVTINSRLIQESADRTGRLTCTNVHAFVNWRTANRASRPLQRAELSGKFGRPHGSTDRELDSQLQWVGRPWRSTVAPTVRNPTVGGRPHGSTGSSDKAPTTSFWQPIYLGVCGLFYTRFGEVFRASFSHSFQKFFSTK